MRERLIVYQPEHLWEVAERLTWEVRERLIVYQPEHLWEVAERLLHRLVLQSPKATLEILRAYREDPFRAIFGLELDCGKLWRRGITGSRCQPARGPVGGERMAYCLPARAPVGGHRTAASQTSFTESESDVTDSAGVRGGPLQGDFWSRIRLWKAVARGNHWEQVSTTHKNPWEVRERLFVYTSQSTCGRSQNGCFTD